HESDAVIAIDLGISAVNQLLVKMDQRGLAGRRPVVGWPGGGFGAAQDAMVGDGRVRDVGAGGPHVAGDTAVVLLLSAANLRRQVTSLVGVATQAPAAVKLDFLFRRRD